MTLLIIPGIVKIWMILFIPLMFLIIGHKHKTPIEHNPIVGLPDENSYS